MKFLRSHLFFVIFLLATLFFVAIHYLFLGWDFAVYVLNAKHIFGDGMYFELFRPPLTPFLLGVSSFFGLSYSAGEYIYIICVSAFFGYACIRFAEAVKLDKELFYILILSPYVLIVGLLEGTELLSLALIMLFTVSIIEKKPSGHWIGLATLTRYTNIMLLPLLLLQRNTRRITTDCIIILSLWSPWLWYNYNLKGNIFASVLDMYILDVKFRDYIHQTIQINDFLYVLWILLPLFILGFIQYLQQCYAELKDTKRREKSKTLVLIIMSFVILVTLYTYIKAPIKNNRLLFNLSFPAAFFSYFFLLVIMQKKRLNFKKMKRLTIVLISLFIFAVMMAILVKTDLSEFSKKFVKNQHLSAVYILKELGVDHCGLFSNSYVLLNYYGKETSPTPNINLFSDKIKEGYIGVFFYDIPEPSYIFKREFINSTNVLAETNKFIIVGERNCTTHSIEELIYSYLENVLVNQRKMYGVSYELDYCKSAFDSKVFYTLCDFVSLNDKAPRKDIYN
ncbi:MAG: hypothetical protein QXK37_06500 [Candidatus Woesearchaeota archaeon]